VFYSYRLRMVSSKDSGGTRQRRCRRSRTFDGESEDSYSSSSTRFRPFNVVPKTNGMSFISFIFEFVQDCVEDAELGGRCLILV
jgi:hypothetical protein